ALPRARRVVRGSAGRDAAGIALLAGREEAVTADRRALALGRVTRRLAECRTGSVLRAVALLPELDRVVAARRVAGAGGRVAVARTVVVVAAVALLGGAIDRAVAAIADGYVVRQLDAGRTGKPGDLVD